MSEEDWSHDHVFAPPPPPLRALRYTFQKVSYPPPPLHSWLKHMSAAAKMETLVDSSHLDGDGEEPNGTRDASYDGDADGSELDSSLA